MTSSSGRRKPLGYTLGSWALALILIPTAIIMLMPFIWMVSTSLKSAGEVFSYPPTFIPEQPQWNNYVRIFEVLPFARFFMNSLVVALAVTGLQLVTCSMAAYAFARLRFKGRDTLFLGYLGTLMIPAQVVLIPNFIVLRQLGWIDTYQALILPAAFSAFGTFLLRQYFLTIPRELEDAAVVDGANHWQIRSEEHTSELQSRGHLVCRLLLEKKKMMKGNKIKKNNYISQNNRVPAIQAQIGSSLLGMIIANVIRMDDGAVVDK